VRGEQADHADWCEGRDDADVFHAPCPTFDTLTCMRVVVWEGSEPDTAWCRACGSTHAIEVES